MYTVNVSSQLLISNNQIQKKIKELASQISRDYQTKLPILLGVLNGSYMLMADLSRVLWRKGFRTFTIEFVGVSSYDKSKTSSRNPIITKDLSIDIAGKDVLIIEDIVDTGWTLKFLKKYLTNKKPRSLKTLVLLSKTGKRETKVSIDYLGFKIEGNKWVEGYGLDTKYTGRGNPDIVEVHP